MHPKTDEPTSMRFDGIITTWNDDRAFGFIESKQGGQEIFFHIKSFRQRAGRPQPGQAVSFEIELGPQGKKRAKNVEPVRAARPIMKRRSSAPAQWGTATLFAIPAFLILCAVVFTIWKPSPLLAAAYLGMSAITFLAYALDKSAAQRQAQRTPESTLHVLSLLGGWPGALLAQQYLRGLLGHRHLERHRFCGPVLSARPAALGSAVRLADTS
jgi:uncharacterized membrane protein YsdA (DUF1294 family)/cold shock CspA family protein